MDLINVSHLVFVLKLLEIDASVTITQAGIDAGDGYFECGEKLTLICQIPGNPSTMSWQNDSSNIPLAQCVFNNCELNPDVADKFEFSADESTGIYNLSFTVTNDNNGTTYMCDDGNKVNTTQISIKDLKPTLIQTSQNKLKAVSGCIHQNEKVSFQWKQIKATDNKESDYDISCLEGEESVETATCVSDAECGGLDLIQKVMTIYDEKGGLDDYYLKVVLSYNGVKMESAQTSDTHKVTFPFTWRNIIFIAFTYLSLGINIGCGVVIFFMKKGIRIGLVCICTFTSATFLNSIFIAVIVERYKCLDESCSKMCKEITTITIIFLVCIYSRFFVVFCLILKNYCTKGRIIRSNKVDVKSKVFILALFWTPPPLDIICITLCSVAYIIGTCTSNSVHGVSQHGESAGLNFGRRHGQGTSKDVHNQTKNREGAEGNNCSSVTHSTSKDVHNQTKIREGAEGNNCSSVTHTRVRQNRDEENGGQHSGKENVDKTNNAHGTTSSHTVSNFPNIDEHKKSIPMKNVTVDMHAEIHGLL